MDGSAVTNYIYMDSLTGRLTLRAAGGRLIGAAFGERPGGVYGETPLLAGARAQLSAYFAGELRRFDLPLELRGTDFQKRVWRALMDIPYGETLSYGALAASIGNPGAARAVGGACGKNPLVIVVPCHRATAGGGIGGFSGGLAIKKILLDLEKVKNGY